MKYAILGSGNVGSAIGAAAAHVGHDVVLTATSKSSASQVAEKIGGSAAASNDEAVREADVVVLAVPFGAVPDVLDEIRGSAAGRIVIDATNPIKPDYSGLATNGSSGAELVQAGLPGARVVKAFNTVFASQQAEPTADDMPIDGLYAGDDARAKEVVRELLERIGYRALDAGPLTSARYLEAMAFLNISLNSTNGWPWQSSWKLIGSTGGSTGELM